MEVVAVFAGLWVLIALSGVAYSQFRERLKGEITLAVLEQLREPPPVETPWQETHAADEFDEGLMRW